MNRPLWQTFLTILVMGFALRRLAVLYGVYLAGGEMAPVLVGAHLVQAAAGLATALGLWLGRRWVLGALIVLAGTVVGTALLSAFLLGAQPAAGAVATALAAVLVCGLLYVVLRHELGSEGTAARSG